MKISYAKRHKSAKYPDLEKVLYEWFLQRQEKFSFSSGWLERFKARYSIMSYRRFSESGSVNMEDIENALPEIRLFYRLEADHSLATKHLEGRKKDKERITVAVCCNGDGSDKVPLWVIEFCHLFDKRMNGKKVLLLIDYCPAHPKVVEGLRNIELFFLPPNTTSKIQPCDAGIIPAFKLHYRHHFYSSILQSLEVDSSNPENINILDAINFATLAWRFDVKETTIANCFRHCKIRSEELDVPEAEADKLEEDIERLTDVISKLHYRNVMDVEHLLNYPNENDVIMELPTGDEIIESVLNDENDPEPDDSSFTPNVSSK
ncbi:hypothetical protein OROMI_008942 [Orobanche minor]